MYCSFLTLLFFFSSILLAYLECPTMTLTNILVCYLLDSTFFLRHSYSNLTLLNQHSHSHSRSHTNTHTNCSIIFQSLQLVLSFVMLSLQTVIYSYLYVYVSSLALHVTNIQTLPAIYTLPSPLLTPCP